jgi:hypothetical protein
MPRLKIKLGAKAKRKARLLKEIIEERKEKKKKLMRIRRKSNGNMIA